MRMCGQEGGGILNNFMKGGRSTRRPSRGCVGEVVGKAGWREILGG